MRKAYVQTRPSSLLWRHRTNAYLSPRAILIAKAGSGKTTLQNLVCGTHRPATASIASFTRDLAEHPCCFGDNSFTLVDTPAHNSLHSSYYLAMERQKAQDDAWLLIARLYS
mmetsp:Transcript_11603/g.22622  ORF Transcript_11603/g.22622 Transcript_11603/m.22622 type:complete len:112 (+) Transcript_11603:49-384(+)